MLKQKFILTYGLQLTTRFFGVISGILVARFAGPTVLGTLAFGMSFVMVFSFLTDMGLDTAHIKLVSEGRDLGKCNATFTRLKIGSTLLFLLVIISYISIQLFVIKDRFESSEHINVIFIWILITIGSSIRTIPQATFNAKVERAKVELPVAVQNIVVKTLRVIIAALGFGAIVLASANLFGIIFIIIVYYSLFKKYPFSIFDKELAKNIFITPFPCYF